MLQNSKKQKYHTKRKLQQLIKEVQYSGNVKDVADAQEQIEVVLNTLYDNGVDNEGLKALLNNIIVDIDRGFVGEPT